MFGFLVGFIFAWIKQVIDDFKGNKLHPSLIKDTIKHGFK